MRELPVEKSAGFFVWWKDNLIFARLMDAGKKLSARINGIEQKGSFTRIAIGIYLVDSVYYKAAFYALKRPVRKSH